MISDPKPVPAKVAKISIKKPKGNNERVLKRTMIAILLYRELTAWHHYEAAADSGESNEIMPLTTSEIDAMEEILRHF